MRYFLRADCGPEARSCSVVSGKRYGEKGTLERGLPGRHGGIWVGKDVESFSGGRKALNKGEEADKSLGVQNSKEAGRELCVG